MENQIPAWYLPLLEKIQKNLNEDDLQLLRDIVSKTITPDVKTLKYLAQKMTSWLNTWEKMKFTKMLLHLNMINKHG